MASEENVYESGTFLGDVKRVVDGRSAHELHLRECPNDWSLDSKSKPTCDLKISTHPGPLTARGSGDQVASLTVPPGYPIEDLKNFLEVWEKFIRKVHSALPSTTETKTAANFSAMNGQMERVKKVKREDENWRLEVKSFRKRPATQSTDVIDYKVDRKLDKIKSHWYKEVAPCEITIAVTYLGGKEAPFAATTSAPSAPAPSTPASSPPASSTPASSTPAFSTPTTSTPTTSAPDTIV